MGLLVCIVIMLIILMMIFQEFLTDLGGMSAGPEFERSDEELNQIADTLIAGEDIK